MFEQFGYDHSGRELTQTLHILISKINLLCRINAIFNVECWNKLRAIDNRLVPNLFHASEADCLVRDLEAFPQFIQIN